MDNKTHTKSWSPAEESEITARAEALAAASPPPTPEQVRALQDLYDAAVRRSEEGS